MIKNKIAQPILMLTIAFICFANSDTVLSQDKSTLPYVDSSADVVMSSRPAMMMRSDDYRKLKTKGGQQLDRVINKMTDTFFKASLAEIQEIDQIIFATSVPDMNQANANRRSYDVMVLKTVKDNSTGFDMVTQNVDQAFDYKGEEFFEFKKPISGMYRFAWIADAKTIIWGRSIESIEMSIDSGKKGPVSAQWYELWRQFSGKPVSMAFSGKPLKNMPLPGPLSPFKKIQFAAGGADVARQARVSLKAKCLQASDAKEIAEAVKQGLDMARQSLETQKKILKKAGQEATVVIGNDLVDAAKVKVNQKTVSFESAFTIDFESLVPMLDSANRASKRTEAANSLRQTVLAFQNYESAMGTFPSPVMVHESGKKYSWRIAILPYIEQQALYDEYDFNQEWNSPHNLEVTSQMPDAFRSDSNDKETTNASWFLLSGPEGIGDGENAKGISEITDGTSNTILAVEAKRNVHWAKPEDIQVDIKRGLPKFGGFHEGGFNVAMADGSVRFISNKVDRKTLWSLYTASGGEVVDRTQLDVKDDE